MTEQIINVAQSALAGPITNVATSVPLVSPAGFPTSGTYRVIVDAEIMVVTSSFGGILTVTRGAEGSTAVPHSAGAICTIIVTAGAITQIKADIEADLFASGQLAFTEFDTVAGGGSVSPTTRNVFVRASPGGGGCTVIAAPTQSGDAVTVRLDATANGGNPLTMGGAFPWENPAGLGTFTTNLALTTPNSMYAWVFDSGAGQFVIFNHIP